MGGAFGCALFVRYIFIVIDRESWNQEDVALFEGFKLSPSLSLSGTTTSDSTQDSKKNLPFLAPMSQHTKSVDW